MITFKDKEYKRAIVIGDVHGCINPLYQLFSDCLKSTDLVISVGDLVDRGPDSADVVYLFRISGYQVTQGNHEDKWIRWRKNTLREQSQPGYKNKMRPLAPHDLEEFNKLSLEDHNWLASLPMYLEFKSDNQEYVVVHGGIMPGADYKNHDPKIITRLRYVDKDTRRMIPYTKDNDPPKNGKYWTDFWNRSQKVIYGHQVHDLQHVRLSNNNLCYGIDTGAVFGGHLTAMIIDASNPYQDKISYVQVKSPKYADRFNDT